MLSKNNKKKVILSSTRSQDGVYGDTCVAADGSLERSGEATLFGSALFEPGSTAPDDIEDFTTGEVDKTVDLFEKDNDATEASVFFGDQDCDLTATSLDPEIDLSDYGDRDVYICVDGALEITSDVTIVGGKKNRVVFNIKEGLSSNGANVLGKGSIKPKKIIWNVRSGPVVLRSSVLDGSILAIKSKVDMLRSEINGQLISGLLIRIFNGSAVNCNERPASPPTPAPTNPPTKFGACCISRKRCAVIPEERCIRKKGKYQGDDTNCNMPDINCPRMGACCLPRTGECITVKKSECKVQGGKFRLGKKCEDVKCPKPPTPKPTPPPKKTPPPPPSPSTGACCRVKYGRCHDNVSLSRCQRTGLKWGGAGSKCSDDGFCPKPTRSPTPGKGGKSAGKHISSGSSSDVKGGIGGSSSSSSGSSSSGGKGGKRGSGSSSSGPKQRRKGRNGGNSGSSSGSGSASSAGWGGYRGG